MADGAVLLDISMSVDGFIAQPDDAPGPIHDWLFTGDVANNHNEAFKTSEASREILDEMFETTGALVVGRRTYDLTKGWGGSHPMADVPVFVVTHRAPSTVPEGTTEFTFATDGIEDAIDQARTAAGRDDVMVMGGARVIRQCLMAGLLDEVQLHVAPLLLGDGIQMFDRVDMPEIRLESIRVVTAPDVTHLRYRVVR